MGAVLLKPDAIKRAARADVLLKQDEGFTLYRMVKIYEHTQDLHLLNVTADELGMWSNVQQLFLPQFLETLVTVGFLRKKKAGVFYICGNKREVQRIRKHQAESKKGGKAKRVVQPRDGATIRDLKLSDKSARGKKTGKKPSPGPGPGLDHSITKPPLTPRNAGGSKKVAVSLAAEAIGVYYAVSDLAREKKIQNVDEADKAARQRLKPDTLRLITKCYGTFDRFARDCASHADKRKMAALERRLAKNFVAFLDGQLLADGAVL